MTGSTAAARGRARPTLMQPDQIAALETLLGHRFVRPELLQRALTHSSHAHESGENGPQQAAGDNEQMEFLGDAVLGFVTSETLFQRFPGHSEGALSKLRAHLVSARHLGSVANQLDLGRYLRLGRGEEKSGGRAKAALLVNALEAVLAAIYLDGGAEPARHFIRQRILDPELENIQRESASGLPVTDYKSALQEFLQQSGQPQPSYRVVREEGPEHNKTFTVEVRVHPPAAEDRGEYVRRAEGPTKKKAEQRAARLALDELKARESRSPLDQTP